MRRKWSSVLVMCGRCQFYKIIKMRLAVLLQQILLTLGEDTLYRGEILSADEALTSSNGGYNLQLRSDGDRWHLCTTKLILGEILPYWCHNMNSTSPVRLQLDEDCALRLLLPDGSTYEPYGLISQGFNISHNVNSSSVIVGGPSCFLTLEDDSNLVLYKTTSYRPFLSDMWSSYMHEYFSTPRPLWCAGNNDYCRCNGLM